MWEGEQSLWECPIFVWIDGKSETCVRFRFSGASIFRSLRLLTIFERDLDIFCQLEVLVGYAACVVGRADERDARVVDMDVRMMVGGFCDLGDFLHELDSVQEFFELEHFYGCVVFVLPSGKRL